MLTRLVLLVVPLSLFVARHVAAVDPEVELREDVLAPALRSVVQRSCSRKGIPCCLAVPDGWVSGGFMKRLRGLPVRWNDVDPLLGVCSGNLVVVQTLEWVKATDARVGITVGTEFAGDKCTVSLKRRSGQWTVSRTACEFYSVM
jgi:hypothetical protein